MHFAVTILGNNSAIPTYGRHPTAQVVTLHDKIFLVDCGEGTQAQMSRYKVKSSRIQGIFISHLHGDHYFGLISLLNSFGLKGRRKPLVVYGHAPLQQILQLQLDCAHTQLPFDLRFHTIHENQTGILLKEKDLEVYTFPTNHRIACNGFLFKEKHLKRKINGEQIRNYSIPYSFYKQLQQGKDYIAPNGVVVKNEEVTLAPPEERTYAFCADTLYDERIIPHIHGCHLVYHETTYLREEVERAKTHFHTTTEQAATIAQRAEIKHLLIGHYSSKYREISIFQEETQAVFPPTTATVEGATYVVE